jgi:hypothetical protein
MPQSTFRYPFEGKVHAFAFQFAKRFAPPGRPRTFLITLAQDTSVASLSFTPSPEGWCDQREQLEASEIPYFFFDPFDAPDYTSISWSRIERSVMERMMGEEFGVCDFEPFHEGNGRLPNLQRADFPSTWGVMF